MGWFVGRGREIKLTTRYLPKRHAVNRQLALLDFARAYGGALGVLGFEEADGGKTHIVIASDLIPVSPGSP